MDIRFDNKIVLVTGSSRGIGRTAAFMFAKKGASVVLQYHRNGDMAKELLSEMPGDNHSVYSCDIGDPKAVEEFTQLVFDKYGRVDVLVNNAGIFEEHDIMELNYESWQSTWNRTLDVNLKGAANISFLIAKKMKDLGGCRIVNVSSRGAFRGEPGAPAYGASKAGMNAFGQSLSKAYAKYKIYVFTVAPGFVDTDMAAYAMIGKRADEIRRQSPLNRIAAPEEISRTILFLASEGSEFLTGCIVDQNGASYLRS